MARVSARSSAALDTESAWRRARRAAIDARLICQSDMVATPTSQARLPAWCLRDGWVASAGPRVGEIRTNDDRRARLRVGAEKSADLFCADRLGQRSASENQDGRKSQRRLAGRAVRHSRRHRIRAAPLRDPPTKISELKIVGRSATADFPASQERVLCATDRSTKMSFDVRLILLTG
jgi:hypothetical protein